MGYQDRPYYRDRGSGVTSPLMWLLTGSVPLFTFSGISVRIHASMVLFLGFTLLFGADQGMDLASRLQSVFVLFGIVLLHEFGHCFGARWVGGSANEILMHPLGGLAMAHAPRRPLPQFITVAAGPAVNVLICLICGAVLLAAGSTISPNPFRFFVTVPFDNWTNVYWYFAWIFQISYMLLAFNLLPVFPLDGGQMLQAILWRPMGYYRSMKFATMTGMIGAGIIGMAAIVSRSWFLFAMMLVGFQVCLSQWRMLQSVGAGELEDAIDYSAAYEPAHAVGRRRSRWAAKRALKLAEADRREQERIDQILAKVSTHGMQSLTWCERRALRKATEHQRERDAELSRLRRP